MKKQEILEIIFNNPKAIFKNGNAGAGKYSEFPTWFQVVGMTGDNSYARVREVFLSVQYYIAGEDGEFIRGEDGCLLTDERPLEQRTFLKYGNTQSMPLRLIVKSQVTEESMVSDYIEGVRRHERETQEREARVKQQQENREQLVALLLDGGVIDEDADVSDGRWGGRLSISLTHEQVVRLTSVLKSALVEVGA